jgi:hypothetical protein
VQKYAKKHKKTANKANESQNRAKEQVYRAILGLKIMLK